MNKGKIIILNGVSSAGKSSIAKILQLKLPEPYFCLALDTFTDIISPVYWPEFQERYSAALERQSMAAMYHAIKLYSDLGLNVVVDTVMCDWSGDDIKYRPFDDCMMLLNDYPVFFIKVDCPVHELNRRELERGDREIGIAEYCLGILTPKNDCDYDMIVNTYENTAEECADKIVLSLFPV